MTSFDMSDTIQPNSDQLDACDLLSGPRTFTIERVSKGNAEQPVQIHLAEFPRPWRPGKSMRRVLVACWGPDASAYVGRSVRLFCDNDVVFGGQAVGGTRISAMSHIDKPKKIPLLVSRGKSAIFVVQPLPDAPPPARAGISDAQLKALDAGLTGLGYTDRSAKLSAISDALGREVKSSKDLSADEAEDMLMWVQAEEANAPAEPTLDWPTVNEPGGAA